MRGSQAGGRPRPAPEGTNKVEIRKYVVIKSEAPGARPGGQRSMSARTVPDASGANDARRKTPTIGSAVRKNSARHHPRPVSAYPGQNRRSRGIAAAPEGAAASPNRRSRASRPNPLRRASPRDARGSEEPAGDWVFRLGSRNGNPKTTPEGPSPSPRCASLPKETDNHADNPACNRDVRSGALRPNSPRKAPPCGIPGSEEPGGRVFGSGSAGDGPKTTSLGSLPFPRRGDLPKDTTNPTDNPARDRSTTLRVATRRTFRTWTLAGPGAASPWATPARQRSVPKDPALSRGLLPSPRPLEPEGPAGSAPRGSTPTLLRTVTIFANI